AWEGTYENSWKKDPSSVPAAANQAAAQTRAGAATDRSRALATTIGRCLALAGHTATTTAHSAWCPRDTPRCSAGAHPGHRPASSAPAPGPHAATWHAGFRHHPGDSRPVAWPRHPVAHAA